MGNTVDSDSASEFDDQSKSYESDPRSMRRVTGDISKLSDCGVGHRVQASRSVLALALDDQCVFAGLQGGDIVAWSLDTFSLVLSVHAHKESVLGLYLSESGNLLFSSGGDSVVNVWSTETFQRLYSIYSHHDVGDIFAVAYSSTLKTIYCGGQNTSIQWCDISKPGSAAAQDPAADLSRRVHRFFDSRAPDGSRTESDSSLDGAYSVTQGGRLLNFKRDHHKLFSHHGYVYTMLLARGLVESAPSEEVLLTGSGDGAVKMWRLSQDSDMIPNQMVRLQNGDPVLSVAVDGSFLYCGLAGGTLNIWNLDSHQLIKRVKSHSGDLWAVDIIRGVAVCGDSDGIVKKFNSRFEELGSWVAHEGTMLASAAGRSKDRYIYATGGNDNTVGIWDLTELAINEGELPPISNDELVNTLAKLVAFKTIPANPEFSGECNQGAAFLRRHCNYLGAKTKLLATGEDTNPIVYARFSASSPGEDDKTLLFYGHYDVVGTNTARQKWKTDPYQLASINGFLYGRGVTDNKGPVLAALYAAADLVRQRMLRCNVVFLIEGEEEAGSQGFQETVRQHKSQIGPVDWILLANSYWLDDYNPCLTYGLRGVVHANLIVTSDHPDLHSGIDGSSLLDEPLKDLSMLLSTLVGPKGRINLPGFHNPVLSLTKAEKQRYTAIADLILPDHPEIPSSDVLINSLMHRWREPSLTIHSVEVPGSTIGSATIACKAKASVSIRIVPNQDVDEVAASLTTYAQEQFASLESQNLLVVEITRKSDAWLGDPDSEIFEILSRAITAVWTPSLSTKKHQNYPLPADLPSPTSANIPSIDRNLSSHFPSPATVTPAGRSPEANEQLPSKRSASAIPTSSTLANRSTSLLSRSSPTDDKLSEVDSAIATTASSGNPAHAAVKPIYIREGGSIPTIRFLEKEFLAPAANLPCGQASDNAHLDNERLRIENLYKSREIFRIVFAELPRRTEGLHS